MACVLCVDRLADDVDVEVCARKKREHLARQQLSQSLALLLVADLLHSVLRRCVLGIHLRLVLTDIHNPD